MEQFDPVDNKEGQKSPGQRVIVTKLQQQWQKVPRKRFGLSYTQSSSLNESLRAEQFRRSKSELVFQGDGVFKEQREPFKMQH